MVELGVIAGVVVLYGLFSRRLEGTALTAPMVFVGAGLLLGWTGVVDFGFAAAETAFEFEIGNDIVLAFFEVTLVLLLFTDATRLNLTVLRGNKGLPSRLLVIGLPLSIALGGVLAGVFLLKLSFWEAAIVGAVLAPTDAALGHAVVSNKRVPVRIRQALNVESGLNDGGSVPFLTLFVALAAVEANTGETGFWIRFAFEQIGYGMALGIGVGLVGGFVIDHASKRGWMLGIYQQLGIASLAIVAWASAEAVGGNGFIAAFVAGLAAGSAVRDLGEMVADFSEDQGKLLSLAVFFIFGAIATETLGEVTWAMLVYAILSLTIVRMLPVAISLAGTGLATRTVAYMGWFGPRGLASIILAFVVLEEETLVGRGEIFVVMCIAVLLSVFLHGMTAGPLSAVYANHIEASMADDDPEMEAVTERPTRGGL